MECLLETKKKNKNEWAQATAAAKKELNVEAKRMG
jgi:hypothetical protein